MELGKKETFSNLLTAREEEILNLVSKGLNNVEIKERLFIENSTVKYHIKNIMRKLKVNNRIKAIILSIQTGVIDINKIKVERCEKY